MWGNKCPNCAKKIKKDFSFCPYCGISFKQKREQEEFGLLGRDDFAEMPMPNLPALGGLGNLDKIIAPLMKQLVEQFDKELGVKQQPKGFKIQITTNKPPMREQIVVNEKEIERRRGLPRKEAGSNVRRLSDRVLYEIEVPGVKSKEDIIITKLENSIEVKAYSKDACYVKVIPLKVDVLNYKIKDGTLFLEIKS